MLLSLKNLQMCIRDSSKADIVINSGKNDVAFDLFVSKISMELEKRKQG